MDEGLMPHGMCYLWEPSLLRLHVVSDGVVALSYFVIPPLLVFLLVETRRRLSGIEGWSDTRVPQSGLLLAFALFIVSCGITHTLGVVTVWEPIYWVSGSAKAVTAFVSASTAGILLFAVPRVADLFVDGARLKVRTAELQDANASLERMAEQVRDAERERAEGVARMAGWLAHDLNNRFQVLRGAVDLVPEDAGIEEELRMFRAELSRAAGTVRNLEVLAGTTGPTRIGPVRLLPVLRSRLRALEAQAALNGLDETVVVNADPAYLEKVLEELLQNAVDEVGTDEIRVDFDASVEGGALTISNRAATLSRADLDQLFRAFYSNRFNRSGLGLAMVRQQVRDMGAEVDASLDESGRLHVTIRFAAEAPGSWLTGGD
jgi:signal transduction histidine kinase